MKYDTVKELNKRKGCVEIKKIIQNHLGSETTEQIWQKAIRKLQQFHFRLTIATFRKPVLNIFSSYRRKSLEKKEIKHIRGASFPLA